MKNLFLTVSLLVSPPLLPAAPVEMTVHVINVGQANSALLIFPCGAILIDAGSQDAADTQLLIDYLTKAFSRRPDLANTLETIFVTHPHKDHTAALRPVIEHFHVKRFIEDGLDTGSGLPEVQWVRNNAHTGGRSITVRKVADSQISPSTGLTDGDIDPLSCPDCDPKITILAGGKTSNPGWSTAAFENENNHSLVIRVDFGLSSFLFTGDLEKEGIGTLLAKYPAHSPLLDADVYHVGHHGSANGTTSPWLDAITPKLAIISVGEWNFGYPKTNGFTTYAYGHPRWAALELLAGAIHTRRTPIIFPQVGLAAHRFATHRVRQKIYATAWDGNIIIKARLDGTFAVTRKN